MKFANCLCCRSLHTSRNLLQPFRFNRKMTCSFWFRSFSRTATMQPRSSSGRYGNTVLLIVRHILKLVRPNIFASCFVSTYLSGPWVSSLLQCGFCSASGSLDSDLAVEMLVGSGKYSSWPNMRAAAVLKPAMNPLSSYSTAAFIILSHMSPCSLALFGNSLWQHVSKASTSLQAAALCRSSPCIRFT